MFTIVRKFKLARGSIGEVTKRVTVGFVPLLRDLPGFRNYYLLDGGPDVLISIRVFNSADEALASNEIAAEWIERQRHGVREGNAGGHGWQRNHRREQVAAQRPDRENVTLRIDLRTVKPKLNGPHHV